MTNKERISKDISLAFDFAKEIVKNPKILDSIPNGVTICFLDNDQPIQEKENPPARTPSTREAGKEKNNKYIRIKRQFEVI